MTGADRPSRVSLRGRVRARRGRVGGVRVLSRAGVLVLIGSLALFGIGLLAEIHELLVLGAIGVVLVVVAVGWVVVRRPRLAVRRAVIPDRVPVGHPSRVTLTIANGGRWRSPVATLADQVTGTVGARLWLAALHPGAAVEVAYQLPTHKRGRVVIGPLTTTVTDPFGLSSRARPGAGLAQLLVLPHVDAIAPVPHAGGRDPHAGQIRPNLLGLSTDFYALRNYVRGDDLRRVHWRSSARAGELMVRQEEQPWEGRVTVLVDSRSITGSRSALELTISAAASILTASSRRGDGVRLVAPGGIDTGSATGPDHLDRVLDELAVMEPSAEPSLAGALQAAIEGEPATLVAVLAAPSEAELDRLAEAGSRWSHVVVLFERSSWNQVPGSTDPGAVLAAMAGRRTTTPAENGLLVRVSGNVSFPAAWQAAVGASRPAAPANPPVATAR